MPPRPRSPRPRPTPSRRPRVAGMAPTAPRSSGRIDDRPVDPADAAAPGGAAETAPDVPMADRSAPARNGSARAGDAGADPARDGGRPGAPSGAPPAGPEDDGSGRARPAPGPSRRPRPASAPARETERSTVVEAAHDWAASDPPGAGGADRTEPEPEPSDDARVADGGRQAPPAGKARRKPATAPPRPAAHADEAVAEHPAEPPTEAIRSVTSSVTSSDTEGGSAGDTARDTESGGAGDTARDTERVIGDTTKEPAVTAARARGGLLPAVLRRQAVALLAAALVVFTAVAVVAGIQDARLRGTPAAANTALVDVGPTAEVAGQLSDAIETVYSFDFARLDENENAAREVITPAFAADFDRLFVEVRARAPEQQAVVSATVTLSAVKEITGDRAVLVAFVDQQATRAAPDAESQQLAAAGRLTVTGERVDGRWKIAAVTPL